jgi:hypothetical protein
MSGHQLACFFAKKHSSAVRFPTKAKQFAFSCPNKKSPEGIFVCGPGGNLPQLSANGGCLGTSSLVSLLRNIAPLFDSQRKQSSLLSPVQTKNPQKGFLFVGQVGIEPTQPYGYEILSLARLPITPLAQLSAMSAQ